MYVMLVCKGIMIFFTTKLLLWHYHASKDMFLSLNNQLLYDLFVLILQDHYFIRL